MPRRAAFVLSRCCARAVCGAHAPAKQSCDISSSRCQQTVQRRMQISGVEGWSPAECVAKGVAFNCFSTLLR